MATKKAAAPIAHVLSDQERLAEIIKRLSRAQGQLGGIIKMLETGRSCDEVITQIAAVGKAIEPQGMHTRGSFRCRCGFGSTSTPLPDIGLMSAMLMSATLTIELESVRV